MDGEVSPLRLQQSVVESRLLHLDLAYTTGSHVTIGHTLVTLAAAKNGLLLTRLNILAMSVVGQVGKGRRSI